MRPIRKLLNFALLGFLYALGTSAHEIDVMELSLVSLPSPNKHGFIDSEANCETILSESPTGVAALDHTLRKESNRRENGFGSVRLLHDGDLLCVQETEFSDSKSRVTRFTLQNHQVTFDYFEGRVKRLIRKDLAESKLPSLITTYFYTEDGLVRSIDGPRNDINDITYFSYDSEGNLIEISNALGHRHLFQYNESGQASLWINPIGLQTKFIYDETGNLDHSVLADGTIQLEINTIPRAGTISKPTMDSLVAHASGTISPQSEIPKRVNVFIDRPLSDRKSEAYEIISRNAFGQPLKIFNKDRGIVEYEIGEGNIVMQETSQFGSSFRFKYDALSRPIEVTRLDLSTSERFSILYDDCTNGIGQICQIDSKNEITTYHYDNLGRLESYEILLKDTGTSTTLKVDPDQYIDRPIYYIVSEFDFAQDGLLPDFQANATHLRPSVYETTTLLDDQLTPNENDWLNQGKETVYIRLDDLEDGSTEYVLVEPKENTMQTMDNKLDVPVNVLPPAGNQRTVATSTASSPSSMVTAFNSTDCSGERYQVRLDRAWHMGYRSYFRVVGTVRLYFVTIVLIACTELEEPPSTTIDPIVTPWNPDTGDCTAAEHRNLQDKVDELCKRGRVRKCERQAIEACVTILYKIDVFDACISARTNINNTCFRGGDMVHQTMVQDLMNGLGRCHDKAKAQNCY